MFRPDRQTTGVVPVRPPAVPDFRRGTSQGLALASVVPLVPIAGHNLLQGRVLLGVLCALIAAMLVAGVLHMRRTGREAPLGARIGFAAMQVVSMALSIDQQGMQGAMWAYPTVLSFYLYLPERLAWAANAALLCAVLPVAAAVFEAATALRFAATVAGVSVFSAILVNVIGRQQALLEWRIATDPLTGLRNRAALGPGIAAAIGTARREGVPMALLAVDLDHFKRINDTLGHEAGDEVLRGLGDLLIRRSGPEDAAYRLGGEEFLVLLRGASAQRARQRADTLREAIGAAPLLPDRTVTASIGIAALTADDDERSWIRRADEALYRAKAGGRDRVEGPDVDIPSARDALRAVPVHGAPGPRDDRPDLPRAA